MKYKTYMIIRVLAAMACAFLGVWAAATGNVVLIIPAVAVLGVILFLFKRRVKEVVVDERVNTIAYRATRLAFMVFITLAFIAGMILIWMAENASDAFFQVGLTLNYSACALMVFYWLAYFYYNKKYSGDK